MGLIVAFVWIILVVIAIAWNRASKKEKKKLPGKNPIVLKGDLASGVLADVPEEKTVVIHPPPRITSPDVDLEGVTVFFVQSPKPENTFWKCRECGTHNEMMDENCVVCGSVK